MQSLAQSSSSHAAIPRRGRTSSRARQLAVNAVAGASSSGRRRSPPRPASPAPIGSAQPAAASPTAAAAAAPAAETAQVVTSSSGSTLSSYEELTFLPEDFELPAGVLSGVDRDSALSPDDVFRCPGCTKPDCMVRGGVGEEGARALVHGGVGVYV